MDDAPGFRPLYRQVKELLARRIAGGAFAPGAALPSEQALTAELGVSQGTVRKALDALAADKLVERRQGKGTFVAEVTAESSIFQFFRLARANGERLTPASLTATARRRPAEPDEAARLALDGDEDEVVAMERTRLVDVAPAILERIAVPAALFPGLERREIPNALYTVYQADYGVSILSADEALTAVPAPAEAARALDLDEGSPILSIHRIARDFEGRPVEWRRSLCDTRHLVYAVTLR